MPEMYGVQIEDYVEGATEWTPNPWGRPQSYLPTEYCLQCRNMFVVPHGRELTALEQRFCPEHRLPPFAPRNYNRNHTYLRRTYNGRMYQWRRISTDRWYSREDLDYMIAQVCTNLPGDWQVLRAAGSIHRVVACDACETLSSQRICSSCQEDGWGRCEGCNTLSDDLDNDDYCPDCAREREDEYDDDNESLPHAWEPREYKFYGETEAKGKHLTLGCEVETEYDGSLSNASYALDELDSSHKHFWHKGDGSLRHGIEICSHPATLDYHRDEMPWKDLLEVTDRAGNNHNESGRCGLHIHVGIGFFGNINKPKAQERVRKVVLLYERLWRSIYKFSRRDDTQYCGRQLDSSDITTLTNKWVVTGAKRVDRYMAVNLNNTYTVEFRIFDGVTEYAELMASLEFTDLICRIAYNITFAKLFSYTWEDLIERAKDGDYPTLVEYLEENDCSAPPTDLLAQVLENCDHRPSWANGHANGVVAASSTTSTREAVETAYGCLA